MSFTKINSRENVVAAKISHSENIPHTLNFHIFVHPTLTYSIYVISPYYAGSNLTRPL